MAWAAAAGCADGSIVLWDFDTRGVTREWKKGHRCVRTPHLPRPTPSPPFSQPRSCTDCTGLVLRRAGGGYERQRRGDERVLEQGRFPSGQRRVGLFRGAMGRAAGALSGCPCVSQGLYLEGCALWVSECPFQNALPPSVHRRVNDACGGASSHVFPYHPARESKAGRIR